MSEQVQSTERRSQTAGLISSLVNERQEMLVMYAGLAGLEPYTEDKPVQASLKEFCQILVDYIAAGHFGLYERISSGQERRRSIADLANRLYPRIAETTEVAINFNDRYEKDANAKTIGELPDQLSRLGEELATRIELEDQIIQGLMAR